ncbi:hypothetical protein EV424DRAFT_59641 [Suillus variegatus]|nr:hypothetical protein EV424DRAFT_59641 [Suillus variegatus]
MTTMISIAIASVFLPGLPVRLSDPCASATKDPRVLGPCLIFTSSVFFQAQREPCPAYPRKVLILVHGCMVSFYQDRKEQLIVSWRKSES